MDKELEKTGLNRISPEMLELTSALAENLAQSEPFIRFKAAESKLNTDKEALHMLAELSELQQKIRTQQYAGGIIESDLMRLRELQNAIGAKDTIQDHLLTQEFAVGFLREVNQEISNLLGIDFASLTRRSGCC